MEPYKLNANELHLLVAITCLDDAHPSLSLHELAQEWFRHMVEPIVSHQSALAQDGIEFLHNLPLHEDRENHFFSTFFADKIEINSIEHILFSGDTSFNAKESSASEYARKKLYKSLYKNHEAFADVMAAAVDTTSDTLLFTSYFNIMRERKAKKIPFDSHALMHRISRFPSRDVTSCKQKISAYVNLLERNETLYDFVSDDLSHAFEQFPTLYTHWENQVAFFPQDVVALHSSKKQDIDIAFSSDRFLHVFELNHLWVIRNLRVPEHLAYDIRQCFYGALIEGIEQKMNFSLYCIKASDVYFITTTQQDNGTVKQLCDQLTPHIPQILDGLKGMTKPKIQSVVSERLKKYQSFIAVHDALDQADKKEEKNEHKQRRDEKPKVKI